MREIYISLDLRVLLLLIVLGLASYYILFPMLMHRRKPIDYSAKCKRLRVDEVTPCLCCQGECYGDALDNIEPTSPTCSLCGMVNHARPFPKHAISCMRDDCGATFNNA